MKMIIVGKCPHCGDPIQAPLNWWKTTPPPAVYTCHCGGQTIFKSIDKELIDLDLRRNKQ